MTSKAYGKAMRKWRRQKRMTQLELSRILGVDRTTIARCETGISSPDYRLRTAFDTLIARHAQDKIAL